MKRITLLVMIMTIVAMGVGVAALAVLYETAFEQQRQRLVETAKSQARLMEAVARFDQVNNPNYPRGARAATIKQIRDAHANYIGFGDTGEFTLARRDGNDIVFLLRHRHSRLHTPAPVPFHSNLAEPMRRTLSGRSGTVVGPDYRGVTVLAAYEPVSVLDLGIVAKIDLAEIRAPFLRAVAIVLTLAIPLIAAGTILFYRISNPIIRKIRESEERLKAILDTTPSVVFVKDLQGRHILVNRQFELATGSRKQDVLGRTDDEIFPKEVANHLRAADRQVLEGGQPVLFDETVPGPEGMRYYVSAKAPIKDSSGKPYAICGIATDITEHKRTEKALDAAHAQLERRVEERTTELRHSLQHQRIIADILRYSLRAISLEEMLKEMLRLVLTSHELRLEHKGCIFLADDNTRELVMAVRHGLPDSIEDSCGRVPFGTCICGRVAESGQFLHVGNVDDRHEIRYAGMTQHGHYCAPIQSNGSVFGVLNLYVSSGQQRDEAEARFVKAVADTLAGIIRRKRAEEALAETQARYQDLYDNAPDMFASVDAASAKIIQCNRTLTDTLGYGKDEIVNRGFFDIFQPDCLPLVRECFRTFVQTGAVRNAELQLRRKDGKRIEASMNVTAVRDENGEVLHGRSILRDITERKLSETLAREHQAQLAHVARLGTAGEMATGIAHEVNQPLTAMVTNAQACLRLIDSGKADLVELREAMQDIAAQGLRAGEIIRRLKAFTRLKETKRTIIGINELVTESVRFVEAEIREKDIRLHLELADRLPPIMVDTIQLEQVILNLLRNAMEALDGAAVFQREMGVQTAAGESGMVELLVSDSGVGLPEEIAERIFEAFVSTKPQGMGLGLSISRSIVQTHGGRLWVDPPNEKRTVFHLALPMSKSGGA